MSQANAQCFVRVRELELSVSPPADLAGFHESDAGFETRLVRSAMIFFPLQTWDSSA